MGADPAGFRDLYPQVKKGVVLLVNHLGQNKVGTGTGFVVDSNSKFSLVLTNAHVVKGAKRLQVIVGNSQPVAAKVLALNSDHDLALCKIAAGNLPILRFSPDPSMEGTEVAVVGYPLTDRFQGAGMEVTATVTRGIISAHRKVKGAKEEVYQLDAGVNPGNSGGPVFDWETGLVVGVTVFRMRNAAGLNFAVPENLALRFLKQQMVEPTVGTTGPRASTSPGPVAVAAPTATPTVRPGVSPRPETSREPSARRTPRRLERQTQTVSAPEFPWGILVGMAAVGLLALVIVFFKTRSGPPAGHSGGNTGELEL